VRRLGKKSGQNDLGGLWKMYDPLKKYAGIKEMKDRPEGKGCRCLVEKFEKGARGAVTM